MRGLATIADMPNPPPGPAPGSAVPSAASRWPSRITLILAAAALALSGWALFRTFPDSATELRYTGEQQQQAEQRACAAADLVRRGVTLNTGEPGPVAPDDVAGTLAAAANARLALYDGGQYLLARLEPATPTELAEAVQRLAGGLTDLAAAATAGVPDSDPAQTARRADAEAADAEVRRLCAG